MSSSPDVQREDEQGMDYFSQEFEAIVLADSPPSPLDFSDIKWSDYPPRRLTSKPSWSDLWPSAVRGYGVEVEQGTVDPRKLVITPPLSPLPIGDQNHPTPPASPRPLPTGDDTDDTDEDPPVDPPSDASPSLAADPSAVADGPEKAAPEEENPEEENSHGPRLRRSGRSRRPPNWLGDWVLE
ncbi:hypothetical protein V8E54_006579 [Elaphomyces granulatus]